MSDVAYRLRIFEILIFRQYAKRYTFPERVL